MSAAAPAPVCGSLVPLDGPYADFLRRENFEGEPKFWHRHPDTGRRRENGDPERETIAW